MKQYYAAVEGDSLSNSPNSRVLPSGIDVVFIGDNSRSMAFVGGDAYCDTCKSIGKIIGGSGCSESARLLDELTNQRQAVAGDIVQCKCTTKPFILARYGLGWIIEDVSGVPSCFARPVETYSTTNSTNVPLIFNERFRIRNQRTGMFLSNLQYRILCNGRVIATGKTDMAGLTQRVNTDAVDTLELQVYEE